MSRHFLVVACTLFAIVAFAVRGARAHSCIHERLQQTKKQWPVDTSFRRFNTPILDVKNYHMDELPTESGGGYGVSSKFEDLQRIRDELRTKNTLGSGIGGASAAAAGRHVELDFSHSYGEDFKALWDVDGLCVQNGDFVTMGDPSVHDSFNAAAHTPRCTPGCDYWPYYCVANSTSSNKGGCNCFFECESEDKLTFERREFLWALFNETVDVLESTLQVRRLPSMSMSENRTACQCGNDRIDTQWAPTGLQNVVSDYSDETEADLVLFVTARSTRFLSGDVLAYACSCGDDYYLRPNFGLINWGPNKIDYQNEEKFLEQLGVAIHEITHVLGFTGDKYGTFLDPNITVYYNESLDTLPTRGPEDVTLPQSKVTQTQSSVSVTVDRTDDGVDNPVTLDSPYQTTYIVTPKVIEHAQSHFNCMDIGEGKTYPGVELENQGQAGTAGSHWEKRLFENEYMTGSSSYEPIMSELTLAFLEDTGWYKPVYEKGGKLLYGNGEGCDFLKPTCDFWTGPYTCNKNQEKHWGCTPDRNTRGLCTLVYHPTVVESPFFMYYPNITNYGGSVLSDYCPMFKYNHLLKSDCRLKRHQAKNLFTRAEVFSSSSRCFDSTLLSVAKQGLQGSGGCHPIRCTSDGKLKVRVEYGWYECSANDEVRVDNYNGQLKCPSAVEIERFCETAPSDADIETQSPIVRAVSPNEGSLGENAEVTITGERLGEAVHVSIGDWLCTDVVNVTDTSVRCVGFLNTATNSDGSAIQAPLADDVKNFFFENPPSRVLDVRVETESGLFGRLDDSFESGASERLLAASKSLVYATICILTFLNAINYIL